MRSEKVSLQLDWIAIYIGATAEAISVENSSCELKVARWWRENFQLNFAAVRRVLHAIFLNYHKSMAICNLQLIYRPLIASNNGKINRIIKIKKLGEMNFFLFPSPIFVHSSNFLFSASRYYFPLLPSPTTAKWWTLIVESTMSELMARKSFFLSDYRTFFPFPTARSILKQAGR